MTNPTFISPESNDGANAPFGPLGNLIDIRTYRRWLPEKSRRETLAERNARVVNYNISLALGHQDTNSLQQEAEEMYKMLNELKVWPSGRTSWVGGTSVSSTHPMSQFNCSFVAINRLAAFTDLFELLMVGAGVGFRVHRQDIEKLPQIVNLPEVKFEPYTPVDKNNRLQETLSDTINDNVQRVVVGDSRDGWITALECLFSVVFNDTEKQIDTIEFNFDNIRPIGERIKGFGGTASGPKALEGILSDVLRILKEVPETIVEVNEEEYSIYSLRSIDCMDIACAIAKGVVAGSARRSALICLFEEGDTLCANAKKGLYTDPDLAYKSYRAQSNNTENLGTLLPNRVKEFLLANPYITVNDEVVHDFLKSGAPSVAELTPKFDSVKSEGEPGFDNWERMIILRFCAARLWRPDNTPEEIFDNYCNIGTNPCHEILLSAGFKANNYNNVSFCNLTTVPVPNHLIYEDAVVEIKTRDSLGRPVQNAAKATRKMPVALNMDSLQKAFRMAARIGLRQTLVTMPKGNMDEVQQEERLLGVSSTGWRDVFDALNWATDSKEVEFILTKCREWANDEATKYAKELGVERPLLVTTIKPEGTASQVFGTSSGLHWDWSPYYIRRVRMSGADPLAKTLISQGFPAYPEIYDLGKYSTELESTSLYEDWIEMNFDNRKWYQKVIDRVRGISPKNYSYSEVWDSYDNWKKLSVFDELDNYKKQLVLNESNTVVFEFPVKSLAKVSQNEVGALEQLENMRNFTRYYTDHMPSSTITVKEHEWDDVINWVSNNWSDFTTASFLPYYGGNYPLLPYEEIQKDEYTRRVELVPNAYKKQLENGRIMFKVDEMLLQTYEVKLEDPDDVEIKSDGCSTGSCPLR